MTQTLEWVDAWVSKPSVYVVATRNADHIAAAVTSARENDLRPMVKGGAQAARALGYPFMRTARAHNLMYDNPSGSADPRFVCLIQAIVLALDAIRVSLKKMDFVEIP